MFDFLGLYDFFFGLCSSVFLMKMMADLNLCILGSNFFLIFNFVKIDKLISKSKVDVDAYVSFLIIIL